MDEPQAALAMQRIQDHIEACSRNYQAMTDTFVDVKNAIKNTNQLLQGFIGFVVVTVVAFAGYTYVQDQALASQLAESRAKQAQAIQQIPDVTASKVVSKVEAEQQPPSPGN